MLGPRVSGCGQSLAQCPTFPHRLHVSVVGARFGHARAKCPISPHDRHAPSFAAFDAYGAYRAPAAPPSSSIHFPMVSVACLSRVCVGLRASARRKVRHRVGINFHSIATSPSRRAHPHLSSREMPPLALAARTAPVVARAPRALPCARPRGRARGREVGPIAASPQWLEEQTLDARTHRGLYCDWKLTGVDVLEVWAYRGALTLASAGAIETAVMMKFGNYESAEFWYFAGGAGLGAALGLIHMYVSEIRSVMRALWAFGFIGSAVIASNVSEPLPLYVLEHHWTMWAIGPMFAALTGLAFKEGMCYGKPEAAALFFCVPALCLSHLFGAGDDIKSIEAAAVCLLLAIFAGRKFTQELKDDIGDKSIFMFNALPSDDEREQWLARARAAGRDV
jgi:uncharacterized integral membrane protein